MRQNGDNSIAQNNRYSTTEYKWIVVQSVNAWREFDVPYALAELNRVGLAPTDQAVSQRNWKEIDPMRKNNLLQNHFFIYNMCSHMASIWRFVLSSICTIIQYFENRRGLLQYFVLLYTQQFSNKQVLLHISRARLHINQTVLCTTF